MIIGSFIIKGAIISFQALEAQAFLKKSILKGKHL
jgi:hypothetical protein